NPEECIECGICAPECPAGAIKHSSEPKMLNWVNLNAKYANCDLVFLNANRRYLRLMNSTELKTNSINTLITTFMLICFILSKSHYAAKIH
ncbi:MAG: 4Fe-4S dicluster domain-containing protein, partial [Candidatus Hodgkinia cicadicola]